MTVELQCYVCGVKEMCIDGLCYTCAMRELWSPGAAFAATFGAALHDTTERVRQVILDVVESSPLLQSMIAADDPAEWLKTANYLLSVSDEE